MRADRRTRPIRRASIRNAPARQPLDTFDRYAVAEYRTRFADDKAGITRAAYVQQFVRDFDPLQVLAPSPLIAGGLAFKADLDELPRRRRSSTATSS